MAGKHGGWVVMATAFQWQFACNAVFHLVTWIAFGEYSPGAVTATVVSLPATVFYFTWIRRQGRATIREISVAIAAGTLTRISTQLVRRKADQAKGVAGALVGHGVGQSVDEQRSAVPQSGAG